MFSQVSVCPQSASWILAHCSALLQRGRYSGILECFHVYICHNVITIRTMISLEHYLLFWKFCKLKTINLSQIPVALCILFLKQFQTVNVPVVKTKHMRQMSHLAFILSSFFKNVKCKKQVSNSTSQYLLADSVWSSDRYLSQSHLKSIQDYELNVLIGD